LVRAIHMQRTQDPSPNVDDVFWRGSDLSKTKLADALWPLLEKKTNRLSGVAVLESRAATG